MRDDARHENARIGSACILLTVPPTRSAGCLNFQPKLYYLVVLDHGIKVVSHAQLSQAEACATKNKKVAQASACVYSGYS
jgi:hypothetical protein